MKKKKKASNRRSILIGANTAFNIMGNDLELRDKDNLEVSWYNVGVFFKRGIENVSINNGYGRRFHRDEELETY